MGYFINKEIASVNKPNKVTLAHNPHFLQFGSVKSSQGTKVAFSLTVENTDLPGLEEGTVKLSFVEKKSNEEHIFSGTLDANKVNASTFLIVKSGDEINERKEKATAQTARIITAQNLQACLMQNSYLLNNFEISCGLFVGYNDQVHSDNTIVITAKGLGAVYDINLTISPETGFINKQYTQSVIDGYDSIDYNSGNYRIELDIYTDTGVFLGEEDTLNEANKGRYLTTLSKAYHEGRIWFDLNALFGKRTDYSDRFITASDWCNAGTISDFRIIGKRNNGTNHQAFYSSEVLYVVNGYDYTLNENNLDKYIFDVVNYNGEKVKPLTNHPRLPHIKGQKHFFNFILKDEVHNLSIPGFDVPQSEIGLIYRFYTQSGVFVDSKECFVKQQKEFDMVNTIELQLDALIGEAEARTGKTIGRVDVVLSNNGNEASDAVSFNVLPALSYRLNDFAFLNRLGGWDVFNFGGEESVDFKVTADTYYATLMPGYATYNRIESVAQKNVTEQLIAKTQPVEREIVEWLRELSASPAVYELMSKRYVIVDDFALKYNSSDDLFQVEMKYHYSDSFNSELNTK